MIHPVYKRPGIKCSMDEVEDGNLNSDKYICLAYKQFNVLKNYIF